MALSSKGTVCVDGQLVTVELLGPCFEAGFDCRATSGHCPDAAGDYPVLGETYPHTYATGVVGGWSSAPTTRDRGATDCRLDGINFVANAVPPIGFQVDLPRGGTYEIRVALGDAASAQVYQHLDILDGSTVLASITGASGTAGGHFLDAAANDWSAAAWPGSNVPITVTVSGTSLTFRLGAGGGHSGSSTLAHVHIRQLS